MGDPTYVHKAPQRMSDPMQHTFASLNSQYQAASAQIKPS
jgi:hypothetical protein